MPNDPQWGRKSNEGPPDLDDMLRKAQQKIAALLGFRTRGPGGPPSSGGPSRGMVGGGVVFVILLIVAVWLASGFYIRATALAAPRIVRRIRRKLSR